MTFVAIKLMETKNKTQFVGDFKIKETYPQQLLTWFDNFALLLASIGPITIISFVIFYS